MKGKIKNGERRRQKEVKRKRMRVFSEEERRRE